MGSYVIVYNCFNVSLQTSLFLFSSLGGMLSLAHAFLASSDGSSNFVSKRSISKNKKVNLLIIFFRLG